MQTLSLSTEKSIIWAAVFEEPCLPGSLLRTITDEAAAVRRHNAVRADLRSYRSFSPAALPPHSAVRLCLTDEFLKLPEATPPFEAQPQKVHRVSDGKAKPFRTVRRQSREQKERGTACRAPADWIETIAPEPLIDGSDPCTRRRRGTP